MNEHFIKQVQNSVFFKKSIRKQQYFTMASMSGLLAACGTAATPNPTPSPNPVLTNITGDITSGNDIIKLGDAGGVGIVNALAGDDKITGGSKADFIRGNEGVDNIQAGAGVDNIVVIGSTNNAGYTLNDIQNPNGTGIDLSSLVNLAELNNHAVSDAQAGEVIDGGADGAILYVYGTADFTGSTLSNITRIDIHSDVTFSAKQVKLLIDSGSLKAFTGDGSTKITITNDGSDVELDLSTIDLQNIDQLTIPDGVTVVLDQADVSGLKEIKGTGNIKAVTGTLDLKDLKKPDTIVVQDSEGTVVAKPVVTTPVVVAPHVNTAPTGDITIGTTAKEDIQLTAVSTIADVDGLGTFSYQWKAGTDNVGTDSKNYTPNDADIGKAISVVVTYTDAHGTVESVTSNATTATTNVNDVPTGGIAIGSTAIEDTQLTASSSIVDDDGLGTFSYQWKAGTGNVGTDSVNYTPNDADVGKAISVVVTYTDAHGTVETVTSNATTATTNVNDTPSGTVSITGTATEDQILTATNNIADEDGLGTITYQWQRGGINITNADQSTYTLIQDDVGTLITVVASYTDNQGTAETVTSAATTAVINVNDAPTFTPDTTLNLDVSENTTTVTTLIATDEDNDTLGYTLTGVDSALFSVNANGIITFKKAPDYETPLDNGANNIYNITLNAADAAATDTRDIVVTVTDVEDPTLSVASQHNYNDGEANDFIITAALHSNHATDTLSDITVAGVPSQATFNQGSNNNNGSWTFTQAQLTGLKITFDGDYSGSHTFTLSVSSTAIGGAITQNIKTSDIVVTDIAHAPEFASNSTLNLTTDENSTTVTTQLASDLDGDTLTYSLTGADSALFNINSNGVITFKKAPDYETPLDNGANNFYNITLNAADATATDTRDIVLQVKNLDEPTISVSDLFVAKGAEFLVNSEYNSNQVKTSITTLNNGGFVITWQSNDVVGPDYSANAIKAQIYNAAGTAVNGEFLVNSKTSSEQLAPSITALNNGGFVITWYSQDATSADKLGFAIKAQIYNAAGTAVGTEFLVNSQYNSNQEEPSITALNNGGFVITWQSDDDQDADISGNAIKAQIYDATGTAVGTEILVNSRYDYHQLAPAITALNDGGFVITWQSGDNQDADKIGDAIKAQIYNASGVVIGNEFLVNSQHSNNQLAPTITTLNGGGFVITWQTNDPQADTSGYAIKAQIFNAAGTSVGNEFLVNSQYNSNQLSPTVTALNDGGFVITWQTEDSQADSSFAAIKAQIYNAVGTAVGTEFLVNTLYSFDQSAPSITALNDGSFVITWHSDDGQADNSGTAIKAQIYNSSSDINYNGGTELNYNDNVAYNFNILASTHDNRAAATLSDVSISNIPTEATFTYVDASNNTQTLNVVNGELSLSLAEQNGLKIKFNAGFNGKTNLTVSVTSTDNTGAGQVATTTIIVPVSVGHSITGTTGVDSATATTSIDHVQLGTGTDSFEEAGDIGQYTFEVKGNNLQITHTASGETNVDLLNSVETLTFSSTVGSIDVANLHTLGHISNLTSVEYDFWLSHSYNYDL